MKINIIIATSLILLFAACGSKKEKSTEEKIVKETGVPDNNIVQLTPQQVKNAGVETGAAEYQEMHATLNVNGIVEAPPENIISISIPMGGYVKRMMLIPGMHVNKGSVLATIEDQQYIQLQQDYLTGKSKLQFLEADFNRQKGLNATKATSDKLFQQAQNDYNSEEILVRSLAEKLRLIGLNPTTLSKNNISRFINIYAPIAGYVTKINVNTGKYVIPTDVLFELINPKDLHVRLTVFENDASNLKPGQKVVITTNNKPDQKYNATIHLVTPNIGEDRSTEVHCELDNRGNELLPGTYVNAEIQLNNAKVLTVPDDAIVKWENKLHVFQVEGNGKYKLINVQTGASNNGFTGLRSSLADKEIVTKNSYALLMKMKNGKEE
jgi:cobalt-zinc-cadmium efflux system membrane fusion protein